MILIRWTYKFLGLFENYSTAQGLALGVSLGMILAMCPINTLQFWIFSTGIFLLQLNLATLLGSYLLVSIFNLFGGHLFTKFGLALLVPQSLVKVWSFFYNIPLIPFTEFYNPNVIGKLVFCISAALPVYLVSYKLVTAIEPFMYHWWRTTKLYAIYRGYKPYAR